MLIGSSGTLSTHFPPGECARRLNAGRDGSAYAGHVDDSGFQLVRHGRTGIRVCGTFVPSVLGCRVDYRIEFIPWMVWTFVLAYVIGIAFIFALAVRGTSPWTAMIWVIAITAVVVPINLWFSEHQARRLKDYVASALYEQA
jgi:hypothetical protein